MANFHVLQGAEDGRSYRVVFHLPVPNELNRAGNVNIRDAVKEDPVVIKQSLVPWISREESDQLFAGELYEMVELFSTTPTTTLIQLTAGLNTRFVQLTTQAQTELRQRYAFWRV